MSYENHPCFSSGAKHKYGRIHLPVAPACNLQCNYCNRDFHCVNESRPGVTSTVLSPVQAADYLDAVLQKIEDISVIGIAGPGDPFANPEETLETLRLVRERYPDVLLCLATNGLELFRYIDDMVRLRVSHITVTVNAVDPEIGRRIYQWARTDRRMFRGLDAATILLQRQIEGIKMLKERSIIVKINTVVIPGINDAHAVDIAGTMASMGVDIMNCIPIYHVGGTPFEDIQPPSRKVMETIRNEAGAHVSQMNHCSRCRADAVGLLSEDNTPDVTELLQKAACTSVTNDRPYVAVASMEGIFVNQHLGEASQLWIFGLKGDKIGLIGRRSTPSAGGGLERWQQMAVLLQDCSAILVSGIGSYPRTILERTGVRIVSMEGFAQEGLEAIFHQTEIPKILLKTPGKCSLGKGCSGTGMGCG